MEDDDAVADLTAIAAAATTSAALTGAAAIGATTGAPATSAAATYDGASRQAGGVGVFAAAWRPCGRDTVELSGAAGEASALATFSLPKELYGRLHPYQRTGVAWMATLFASSRGGLLADDMGLGKTVQVCTFLHGLRRGGARHALVLMPVTLLDHWMKEASVWCGDSPVHVYQGTPAQRAAALRAVARPCGGVLLASYGIFCHHASCLAAVPCVLSGSAAGSSRARDRGSALVVGAHEEPQDGRPWDVVVCDEAHKLRNASTQLGRGARSLVARCRLLLTGTPVQNSIQDLWALMDVAQPGLLGNRATFVRRFADPIAHGSVRNATPYAAGLKIHLSEQLWDLVSPHLLRRTKVSVGLLAGEEGAEAASSEAQAERVSAGHILPPKRETIVWLAPTEEQAAMYRRVLADSEVVRQAARRAKLGVEVFQAIGLLKRLCNHPLLAESSSSGPCKETEGVGTVVEGASEEVRGATKAKGRASASCALLAAALEQLGPDGAEVAVAQSAKLRCLAPMLQALGERRHRTLIFAQGTRMLDLIELCVLQRLGIGYLRIDGHTDVATRAKRLDEFRDHPDLYQCMLLTTSVGGYGLNITSANRVVIVDPAWNPATDQQAIDRVHRIGQTREVRVYRLIMSGLIEDKMFRLQVFKMGLTRTALESSSVQHHYFAAHEIRCLFTYTEPTQGETRRLLSEQQHAVAGGTGVDLGEASEDEVMRAATDDGAQQGWLEAGPSVGLSDVSALFSLLGRSTGAEKGGGRSAGDAVLGELKARIGAAEQRAAKAAERRRASEADVEAATAAAEGARQRAAAASQTRMVAQVVLEARSEEWAKICRLEAAAAQRLQDARRAAAEAAATEAAAEERQRAAAEEAEEAAGAAKAAYEVCCAARRRFEDAIKGVRCLLQQVDDAGAALPGGCFDAPATGLRVTRRALGDLTSALARASAALLSGVSGASGAGEEERLVACVAALRKAGLALAASLREVGSPVAEPRAVAAAVREAAAAKVHHVEEACREFGAAQQAWRHVAASTRPPQLRASAEAATLTAAAAAAAEAARQVSQAAAAHEARRRQREGAEAARGAAAATRYAAEAEEVRQRDDANRLTCAVGAEYLGVLRSRAAEEEAVAGRSSLRTECSKAERLLAQMALTGAAAVEALRKEAYEVEIPKRCCVGAAACAEGQGKRPRDASRSSKSEGRTLYSCLVARIS